MKRIVFITVTLLYCLIACSQNKSASAVNGEDFKVFLDRFNNDFEFQKSRILFPFIHESVEYDEFETENGEIHFQEKLITTETQESEWEKLDLTWDSSYAEREIDAYTQEIETVGDNTSIYYKGVENGIHLQIVFVRKNKQWYLQKIINSSM